MAITFLDVDVRPVLRAGGEPFGPIMQALDVLEPDRRLRLLAPFQPMPLLGVTGSRGFACESRELDGGECEILFRPFQPGQGDEILQPGSTTTDAAWSASAKHLDNPPEPAVRILAAIETMSAGEVLFALLCREPILLFPEPAKRGHQRRGGFEVDGSTYKVLVRVNAAQGAAT